MLDKKKKKKARTKQKTKNEDKSYLVQLVFLRAVTSWGLWMGSQSIRVRSQGESIEGMRSTGPWAAPKPVKDCGLWLGSRSSVTWTGTAAD